MSALLKRKSLKKKFRIILSILLVIVAVFGIYKFIYLPRVTKAAWWDESWLYRQRVDLTGISSNQTDFQVAITIDTASLITAGKMQSDCDDLRVTDINGKLLPHWTEENNPGCNNSSTKVWTKVPAISTGGTVLYVYYGNASSAHVENANQVFDYYDNFDDGNYTSDPVWTITKFNANSCSWSVSSQKAMEASNSCNAALSSTNLGNSTSYHIHTRATAVGVSSDYIGIAFGMTDQSNYLIYRLFDPLNYHGTEPGYSIIKNGAVVASTGSGAYFTDGEYHQFSLKVVNTTITAYQDNVERISFTNDTNIPINQIGLYSADNDGGVYYDHVFVTKAALTEPTITLDGTVELSPAPIAYWKFDEGSGSTAYDSTQNRSNGTITGATWQPPDQCISGNCLKYANTLLNTQHTYMNDNSLLDQGSSMTVSSWFKFITQPPSTSSYKVLVVSEGVSGTNLKSAYSSAGYNVVTDTAVTTVEQVAAYSPDIVLCDQAAWSCSAKATLLNSLYDAGYIVVTKGNDSTNNIRPIASAHSGQFTNVPFTPDEKHPLTDGWTSTGNSATDGGYLIDSIHSSAISIARDQTGVIQAIYLEEENKGRWFHYQGLGTLDSTLFTNLNSFILRYAIAGKGKNYNLYTFGNTIYGYVNNKKVSSAFSANGWYHGSLVYDQTGGSLKLYLNGKQVDSASYSTALDTDSRPLIIGSMSKGFIDETRIYPYARSASQIKSDNIARGAIKGISAQLGSEPDNQGTLSQGLAGYWKMDESSGNVADSSGNNQTGTVTGPTVVSGKYGNALSFDGDADYIDMGTNSVLEITNELTFSFWLKASSLASRMYILDKHSSSESGYYGHIETDGSLYFFFGTNGIHSNANAITPGKWTHVVIVGNNSKKEVYIDGVVNKSEPGATWGSTTSNFYLGNTSTNQGAINGSLDEVRIYNRALSPYEVRQLYHWAPGPVGYWKLDEGEYGGTTGEIKDSSSYGNSGLSACYGEGCIKPTTTNAKFGKGVYVDGVDDYLDLGNGAALNPGQSSFTMMFWGKIKSAPAGAWTEYMGKYGDWYTGSTFEITQNYALIRHNNTTYSKTYSPIVDNKWHHIAAVVDREEQKIKVYIDGKKSTGTDADLSAIGTDSLIPNGNLLINHGIHGTAAAEGVYDEIKFYNYARTSDQIVEDMNAGHPIGGSPVGSQALFLKFDEGYNNTANNSGNAGSLLNGTLNNVTWVNSGKIGKAVDFIPASDAMISLGSNSALNETDGYTLSTWIYTDSFSTEPYPTLFSKNGQSGTAGFIWIYQVSGGDIRWQYANGTSSVAPTINCDLATGTWQHLALVHDRVNKTFYCYVDGIRKGTTTYSDTALTTTTGSAYIGTYQGSANDSYHFDGKFDEYKIYNTALTEEEIKLDMNQGSSLVLGQTSTSATGVADSSSFRTYCPPGNTEGNCAAGQNPIPLAEWKFEEKKDGYANDTSDSEYTGTLANNPSWLSADMCKIGTCLSFSGTSSVNTILNTNSLTPPATINAWFYPTQTTSDTQAIVSGYISATDRWDVVFNRSLNGRVGWLYHGVAGSVYSTNTVSLNKWHFVSVVHTGSNILLYLDGVYQGSAATTGGLATNQTVRIGNWYSGGQPFVGRIDEVTIFPYTRTQSQIAWNYNRGAPVAWWKFDECQGNVANDASGNSNNGTITIGATIPQTSVGTCSTSGTAWGNGSSGKYSASLNFDGADDYASITDPTSGILDMTASQNFTMAVWLKTSDTSGTAHAIINKGGYGSQAYRYGMFYYNTGEVKVAINDNNATVQTVPTVGVTLNDGNWHHVTGIVDKSNTKVQLYVDGKFNNEADLTRTGTYENGFALTIGGPSPFFVNGQLDDLRIYNYSLSPAQVKNLFNENSAVRFSN